MTKNRFPRRMLVSMVAMVALFALPSVAEAAKGDLDYMTRGIVVAQSTNTITVCVGTERSSTNEHARPWQGTAVVFTVSPAIKAKVGSSVKVESQQTAKLSKFTAITVDVDPGTNAKHFRGGSCAVSSDVPSEVPAEDPVDPAPVWDS
jgi:hypothetical protein